MDFSRTHLQILCILGILLGIADVGLGVARRSLAYELENGPAQIASRTDDQEFRARVLRCKCGSQLLDLLQAYETRSDKLLSVAAKAQRALSNESLRDGGINAALFSLLLYGIRRFGTTGSTSRQGSENAL